MTKAYLQISLNIRKEDRKGIAGIYNKYRAPFLQTVRGAQSKELLVRDEGVQVLHGFDTLQQAQEYLLSDLFNKEVVVALKPYLQNSPDIRVYVVGEE